VVGTTTVDTIFLIEFTRILVFPFSTTHFFWIFLDFKFFFKRINNF